MNVDHYETQVDVARRILDAALQKTLDEPVGSWFSTLHVGEQIHKIMDSYVDRGQLESFKMGQTTAVADWAMNRWGDLEFLQNRVGSENPGSHWEPEHTRRSVLNARRRPRRALRIKAKKTIGIVTFRMTINPTLQINQIKLNFIVGDERVDIFEGAK